ncbi:putative transporter small subunit [Vibrio pectenicida]|nr:MULTISPECIES: putative transporter small subunit [Vibrio]MBU2895447.1 putative transporter small subunit [Vibrio hepatarius]
MSSLALTLYVLIWPVMALSVMVLLCVSLYRDIRKAKKEGKELV